MTTPIHEKFSAKDISAIVEKYRLTEHARIKHENIYIYLHGHPELSFQESETAATIAKWLSRIPDSDYVIKSSIGGHGLAAILENGSGPKVLLRADMDALPVLEQTGLPYASKARGKDMAGIDQPVMNACGHDMHMASLLMAAQMLHNARDVWSGTLILVFQPAEEKGAGARAMVDDGLYTKHQVPIPDVALGGHIIPAPAGAIGSRRGVIAAGCDSFKVTFHGRGSHASQPQTSIDPIVMAASTVMRLQTLISRESAPRAGNIITVASIRAGEAENVIPDTAEIKVDVRSYDEKAKKRLLDGIRRVVLHEALASGAEKEPTFETLREFPVLYNDETITDALDVSMAEHFGESWNNNQEIFGASEDFGILASAVDRPSCFWLYGGTDPAVYDKALKEGRLHQDIPGNHSALFAPTIQPTLQIAADAYAVAALTFLHRSAKG